MFSIFGPEIYYNFVLQKLKLHSFLAADPEPNAAPPDYFDQIKHNNNYFAIQSKCWQCSSEVSFKSNFALI